MQTETLKVTGMSSIDCIDKVRRTLAGVAGVTDIDVSLLRSEVAVRFDEQRTGIAQIQAALTQAGYEAQVAEAAMAGGGSCCGGCCS